MIELLVGLLETAKCTFVIRDLTAIYSIFPKEYVQVIQLKMFST